MTQAALLKTPLHRRHLELNAKMGPFGGYDMPIQYEGIIAEHLATRRASAVFDTCHMGEFLFSGSTVVDDLERLVSCPVASMKVGQCRYGFICNEAGGVLDDQIVYRLGDNEFFMVVNAATQPADYEWLTSHMSDTTSRENLTDATGKIDLQGPAAPKIMQRLMDELVGDMKFYRCKHNRYRGRKILTSRTGYTGELGFEVYCDPDLAVRFFDECLENGAKPAGLGARDTLRLEMGLPLYGHELNAERNPAESGFTRSISNDKEFIGSHRVLDSAAARDALVGLELSSRRAARAGDKVLVPDGAPVGEITSGSYSPCLEKAVALAYVRKDSAALGAMLHIDTGRQHLEAAVVELPFYKEATGRKRMEDYLD
ncbi:MAG: glycine cleavage system aminomethyltransferase GcvT [Chitinivibrionales bacterium]|nr:glycine cleavage system aminomethyltransferase GcvT [Chitinivibrionales bacterium]MBD3394569.1 glycine cleavage system aminomethyltransferase GcvT [Chitinivibrionales bacterium]